MRVAARHWQTGQPVTILLDAGRVTGILPTAAPADPLPVLTPTLCDLQVNGGHGVRFTDPALTSDGLRTVANACRQDGVGLFLPTVITAAPEVIAGSLRALSAAVERNPDLAAMVPGFHLEGPFVSRLDGYRGAHPAEWACAPDPDQFARWQDAAGGRIRLVTLAPELPGALPFIETLTAAGVVVSLGHTAADPDTIRAAADAGVKLVTHLGNGLPATLPRHDNPLWGLLAEDRLGASVIADGHHLPAGVVRSIARLKGDGLVLVSDASPLAGSPAGIYDLWGTRCEVAADGRVGVAGTPYLAGGSRFLGGCLATALRMGLSIPAAVAAAAIRPRELLGLTVPELGFGEPTDLMLFDECGARPLG